MTRKEKALLTSDNREVNGEIETQYVDGYWHSCCPAFIDCGDDYLDDNTIVEQQGIILGCRGITCQECWIKQYTA